MDKNFEVFMDDLARALSAAAGVKIWEIPLEHRTKDSISAYRSAVGMVGSVVLQVLNKHRDPAAPVTIEKLPEITMPVVEMAEPVVLPEPVVEDEPVPNSLFDESAPEPRRRRRNTGENNAA